MKNNKLIGVLLAVVMVGGLLVVADGVEAGKKSKKKKPLLTKEQALKLVFPKADLVTIEVKTLSKKQLVRIKKRLGEELVLRQTEEKKAKSRGKKKVKSDQKDKKEKNGKEVIFYKGIKKDKKTKKTTILGYAFINKVKGKWDDIEMIVGLNSYGAVTKVAVMSMGEKRGKSIKKERFLKQFFGKTATYEIKVKKDIKAVSGATISSRAATKMVRQAVAIFDELYVEKARKPKK